MRISPVACLYFLLLGSTAFAQLSRRDLEDIERHRGESGKVTVERLCHLNNRGEKKCHGQILAEIYELITELAVNVAVFVREKGFSRFPHETQALFKVVGVADLVAWTTCQTEFVEIAPTT